MAGETQGFLAHGDSPNYTQECNLDYLIYHNIKHHSTFCGLTLNSVDKTTCYTFHTFCELMWQ